MDKNVDEVREEIRRRQHEAARVQSEQDRARREQARGVGGAARDAAKTMRGEDNG